MNLIQKTVNSLDKFQGRHRFLHFGVRVAKKYTADEGGKLSALITYYGFLSVFPFLLALTTVLQLFIKHNENLRAHLTESFGHYFPVVGTELQSNVHTLHQTGLALVVALLLTYYGARGAANAISYAIYRIWRIPKDYQPNFPASLFQSLKLVAWIGFGFLGASVLSSYAGGLANTFPVKLLTFVLSLILLTGVIYMAFRIVIHPNSRDDEGLVFSALAAASGIQVLLLFGGYILTHQLKHLSTLYGAFAVVLGLIFWIYLLVQVLIFSFEAGSIKAGS